MTIIHRDSQLLNAVYPAKYRKDIERRVRSRHIELILGDEIEQPPSDTVNGVTTRHGKSLPDVDLVVRTCSKTGPCSAG